MAGPRLVLVRLRLGPKGIRLGRRLRLEWLARRRISSQGSPAKGVARVADRLAEELQAREARSAGNWEVASAAIWVARSAAI